MVLGDIVLNPADGLVHTIGKVTNKDFGFVKNIADLVFIVLTVVICLVTKGYILGIGANMFKIAGPVLVYGITTSVILGFIYYIFNYII